MGYLGFAFQQRAKDGLTVEDTITLGEGPEFVYLLHYDEITNKPIPCKIGMSKTDPSLRRGHYVTSNHKQPRLHTVIRCENASLLEAQFHIYMAKRRIKGRSREWFMLHPKEFAHYFNIGDIENFVPYSIGERLRLERLRLGLTQTQVSTRTGLRQALISQVETGRSDFRLSTFEKYATALRLQIDVTRRPHYPCLP